MKKDFVDAVTNRAGMVNQAGLRLKMDHSSSYNRRRKAMYAN